jgi:hypothetical protein
MMVINNICPGGKTEAAAVDEDAGWDVWYEKSGSRILIEKVDHAYSSNNKGEH